MGVRNTAGMIITASHHNRRAIAEMIVRCDGNLLRTAHFLGIHRSRIYQLLELLNLWPLVNETRRRAVRDRKLMREERLLQVRRRRI